MTGRVFDPQRWQRLTELFDQALELDAAGRRQLLDAMHDEELRAELQRLLAADAAPGPLDTHGIQRTLAHVEQALLEHAADDDDLIGQRIGAWRIERLLARGGMGRVFLAARDEGGFEQRAALKLLGAQWADDLARRRFLEERRVLATLAHPNIARLLDGGLGPRGEPWYAMEYVDGAALTQWCDARELSLAARLDLFRKVCDAVDFAHRHLVIHRDLKPGNILVDAEGEPKLLDFGIAKLLPAPGAQARSETRMMTPEYAAPEQLRGDAVSTATDVYALGAILFELLTGQRAFPDPLGSRDAPSALRACPTADPQITERAAARATTPKHLRKLLRGDLERILRAALDPDPARRYRTAAGLSADLRRHLRGHPISLRRDRAYRFARYVQRHRAGFAFACIAVLALIATSAFALWQARAARAQARNAVAVKDFMIGVFASADPGEHPGIGPSARELLDAGAQAMQRRFGGDPEIEAALSRALAKSYSGIGAYDRARTLAQHALTATVALHGIGSSNAIEARIDYAEILHDAGLHAQAWQQADIVLQHAGAASEAAVRAHLVKAAADSQLMRDAAAETESRRALALSHALGADRERLQAAAWNDLAQAYLGRNDFSGAQQALREATALYARTRGETAAQTIDARTNLIFLLLHTGHADEALAMYARLVDEERRVLGPNHPALAETLSEYAYMLWDTGRFAQSRNVAREAETALAAANGMAAMQRSDSEMNMAILARLRGDLPGALRILDGIEHVAAPLGADAQRYLFSAHWLRAAVLAERGEPDAVAQLENLRAQARTMHYPLRFKEWMDWPLAWQAQGDPQRALQRYSELSESSTADPRTAAAHRDALLLAQGIALTQLGRNDDARQSLAAAAAAFAGKPERAADAATAQLWQGWLQARSGRPQAGLPDIEAALAWRRAQLGEDSYLTAEARLAHAEALAKLGRRADALAEQAQARAVLELALAPTHVLRRRAELPLPH